MVPVKAQSNSVIFTYAKAIVGGLIAGLSSALAILQTGKHFTASDYITAIIAGLVGLTGVWVTPNK